MKSSICCLLIAVATPIVVVNASAKEPRTPLIQMAILLDTSGSMEGLIDQARAQLWTTVNEFIHARQGDLQPQLQVALYEYGKSSVSAEQNFVRLILPFSTDLDKVSEELFALRTNGGEEYCGAVIDAATQQLSWSTHADDLKVIFIAGNEPFTQGPIDARKACSAAIAKGVQVNTIHCGPHATGVSTHWKDGAVLADGACLNIDHNMKIAHIDAPQDQDIARLGVELNETYIAYGVDAFQNVQRQEAQDGNASKVSVASSIQRAVCKSSRNYTNVSWDLVDATNEGTVKLEEVTVEQLPDNMKTMSPGERLQYVNTQADKRGKIQVQINELNQQREAFVATQRKAQTEAGEQSLDQAMVNALKAQCAKKNIVIEKEG